MSHLIYAERLKQSFDNFFEAPLYVWEFFLSKCKEENFERNQIIKPANGLERNLYFILEGVCGVRLFNSNDNYVFLNIAFENTFFAEYLSLLKEKSSLLETIALEHTKVLSISKENIIDLLKTEWGKTLFFVGTQNYFLEKQQIQIDLLTKTAEERYIELLSKNPDLIQRISQKYIASYLGITTQSLSRIRSKIRF